MVIVYFLLLMVFVLVFLLSCFGFVNLGNFVNKDVSEREM